MNVDFHFAAALSNVIVTPLGSNSTVSVTDSSVPVSLINQTSSINSADEKMQSSSASGSANMTATVTYEDQLNKPSVQLPPNKNTASAKTDQPVSNESYSASFCSSSLYTRIPLAKPIIVNKNNNNRKVPPITENIPSFVLHNSIKAQPIAVLDDNHNKNSLAKQASINRNTGITIASNPFLAFNMSTPSAQQSDANINALLAKLDKQIQKSVASVQHRNIPQKSPAFSLNKNIPESLLNLTLSF